MKNALALLIVAMTLVGCSSLPTTSRTMELAPGIAMAKPDYVCTDTQAFLFKVTVTQHDQNQAFLLSQTCEQGKTTLTILSPQGVNLWGFELIHYDWRITHYVPMTLPFDANLLLTQFVLAKLPVAQTAPLLPANWAWEIEPNTRVLTYQHQPITTLTYNHGVIRDITTPNGLKLHFDLLNTTTP